MSNSQTPRAGRWRSVAIFIIATALSALGWWFGSGLHPRAWVTWCAPLPVLWYATRAPVRWAALAAFLAYAIGALNEWAYFRGVVGLPLAVAVPITAAPAIMLALCALLFRRLIERGCLIAAALAVPTLWVAIDYLTACISPHGTFGNIGYTQMDTLPVIQIAAITGIWGIGFLLLLVPASLAAVVAPRGRRRARANTAFMTIAVAALALSYGALRLSAPIETTMRVGLVSLQRPVRPARDTPDGRALEARYVDAVDRLAAAGARVVILPETALSSSTIAIPAFIGAAGRNDVTLVAGIAFTGDSSAQRNMAIAFGPDSSSPVAYAKHHLVPGLEGQYTPGDAYALAESDPRAGLAVCKDMDFHDIGRAYSTRRAQVLFVPAWDFDVDGWLHSRMAMLRGVESGFAIARAAHRGRLTLSDDRGRVFAEASAEGRDATLVGNLPIRTTHTLYARWGDWFAWLNLVGLVALIALSGSRPSGTPASSHAN